MARVDNLGNFLTDVAGAIREKKGTQDQIPAEKFDTEIKSIETGIDTSDATATVDDVISPKTFYSNGQKLAGAIQPVYEKTNPRLVETNLNVDKTSSELPTFCATFDGENLITFDNSKNFILKNKYGTTLDTKNITDYSGTTSETIYKLASSKVADADGNVYVCAITKNSKNVYFYIFKIDYTTKKLSTNYYRNATSYAYLDCGMNVCFANKRADVLVMFSDARNNDSRTAKITQVNSDLSVTTLSSYTNDDLYWISSVSFNEDDSLLTYNLAHGQDYGNGFIMQLKNYTFTNVRLNAWRTTYTLINTHYLLRRNSGRRKRVMYL